MPRLYRAELAVGLCGQERGAWSVRTVVSASPEPDWPGGRAVGPAMYSRGLRCDGRGSGHRADGSAGARRGGGGGRRGGGPRETQIGRRGMSSGRAISPGLRRIGGTSGEAAPAERMIPTASGRYETPVLIGE